ncbi:MAG: FAD binding domain-containing protein [Gemmatimonadota bacterium]|jgi:4-hydroxybenzoyl-CoA reductase subunit beta
MLRLPEFRHHHPASLADALALLAEHAGNVMPIAGGTDLVPNMKHRLFTPGHVVSLKRLAELRGVAVAGGELVIGAAETLARLALHPLVRRHAPSLARAAGLVAGPQLRTMGTIGGNLCLDTRCTYYNQTQFWRQALGYCLKKEGDVCHVTKTGRKCVAAHSADTPPVLISVDASVELASADATRHLKVADLFIADGVWNSVRRPDEVLTRIRIPLPPPGRRAAFEKLRQRNSIDFPLLNVAATATIGEGERVEAMTVVVSALGARPRVISGIDALAEGRPLDAGLIDEVADRAFQQCHPLTNIIVDPDWRRAMVPVHVRRALSGLIAGRSSRR